MQNSDAHLRRICERIAEVYAKVGGSRRNHIPRSVPEQWQLFHGQNALVFTDKILTDFDYGLRVEAARVERRLQYSPLRGDRNKCIMKECANMRTSLDDGMFLAVAESRPDMMRALIVGPAGTPYESGLFEFDILLPADYPNVPPKLHIKSTSPIFINPNLHGDGTVCLSLLGTWPGGDAASYWQPGVSTILQVLISIRAMIFVEDAMKNDPAVTWVAQGALCEFNHSVQPQTIWFFMLESINLPRKHNAVWKKVIKAHFSLHRAEIVRTIEGWSHENPAIQQWDGHIPFPGPSISPRSPRHGKFQICAWVWDGPQDGSLEAAERQHMHCGHQLMTNADRAPGPVAISEIDGVYCIPIDLSKTTGN